MDAISVRDYAIKEGISLGTAYRRLWEGRVRARKRDGRWRISAIADPENKLGQGKKENAFVAPDEARGAGQNGANASPRNRKDFLPDGPLDGSYWE